LTITTSPASAAVGTAGDTAAAGVIAAVGSTPQRHGPAANTAAAIVWAAVPGQSHRLTYLSFSYAGGTPVGTIGVYDGGTPVIYHDVKGECFVVVPLPPGGIKGTVNTAMTVSPSAGGASVQGYLSAAKITGA
jgi:hypothetical protein